MSNVDFWIEQARTTLQGYEEGLLRRVAARLFRPRNQWPVADLIDRTLATLTNIPVLDRRIKDLSPPCRQVLALIGRSQQPRWAVGSLIEMLRMLGQNDGLEPIQTLFETGLLFPYFPLSAATAVPVKRRVRSFENWLSAVSPSSPMPTVFVPPQISSRTLKEPLGCTPRWRSGLRGETVDNSKPVIREADGLDWPLRLALLWQVVLAGPLRRTLHGDFFKRDLDRLRQDPLLASQPNDALAEIPDPGLLAVSLALALGILQEKPGEVSELIAGSFPEDWQQDFSATLASFWSRLPFLRGWNGADGRQASDAFGNAGANPYSSLYLMALLLVGQLGDNEWAQPASIEDWLLSRHPYWNPEELLVADTQLLEEDQSLPLKNNSQPRTAPEGVVTNFLLGLAFPLRLLQAIKGADDHWLIRLSPLGRWVLGMGEAPAGLPTYPQTLLVQPNLEILAYRQGLTPNLIVHLSRFATWKGLGAACTLQIEPDSVYRALEAGETFASLVQVLERHGMKATPTSVVESLRTWSNKRDRISVYPAGVLLEFPGPAELADALARGLPAVRLSDRLAILPSEVGIDYRHFRLTGTRDYAALPEKCVEVDEDGVTMSVDLTRSDLLLESELIRFAEPLPRSPATPAGRKLYRLTPVSTAAGKKGGLVVYDLERWFLQRTGGGLPAAARLLLTGADAAVSTLRRQLVLHVAVADLAAGLLQWPVTRGLIESRLGPAALSVLPEYVAVLEERLRELGMQVKWEEEPVSE
jgi:Helicase conserved C-terminal domain